MNQENPALVDIRVRQAIQYAVDVDAVVEAAWFGLAQHSTGPVPRGMIGHREHALIPPKGDVEKPGPCSGSPVSNCHCACAWTSTAMHSRSPRCR